MALPFIMVALGARLSGTKNGSKFDSIFRIGLIFPVITGPTRSGETRCSKSGCAALKQNWVGRIFVRP
jgi:hypothetical protein